MANHAKPIPAPTKPEPTPALPEVKWLSIVETPAGFHAALMVTQGDKILRRELKPAESAKRYALDTFRMLAMDEFSLWGPK
jgi:hypothetical protein